MALRADERVHAEQRYMPCGSPDYATRWSRAAAVGASGLPVGPRKQDQLLDVRIGSLSIFLSCLKMANRWLLPVPQTLGTKTLPSLTYERVQLTMLNQYMQYRNTTMSSMEHIVTNNSRLQ